MLYQITMYHESSYLNYGKSSRCTFLLSPSAREELRCVQIQSSGATVGSGLLSYQAENTSFKAMS